MLIGTCALFATAASQAAQPVAALRQVTPGNAMQLQVPLYQSQVVSLDQPAARVSIANPDVADLVVISPTQFYVLAKDIGMTNVLVWDRADSVIATVDVSVTHDLGSLRSKLAALLPGNQIAVTSAQRNIVLSGQVANAIAADTAVRISRGYLAQVQTAKQTEQFQQESASKRDDKSVGEVLNLLEIGGAQQVMLQVKVAEISRTELKRLNAQFNSIGMDGKWSVGGVNGGASFPDAKFAPNDLRVPVFNHAPVIGPVIDEFMPNAIGIPDAGLFTSFLSGDFLFNMAIDAARENGLAKVLAEPTITTLTGQEAKFLSGGEFPIPVPQDRTGVTIEFKEYGVSLKMLPTVLSNGQINVKLDVSVSELQTGSNVSLSPASSDANFFIPALTKRSAAGTVELADGQTIGLAGLINENMRSVVTKFPGLGSIPILGALFRSQEWLKGETELVILV
ncbi:MAG: type II and III secretion system protein family protein, partial [Steroidobacteraceae bacterium]